MVNRLPRRDLLRRGLAAGAGVALIGSTEMLLTACAAADVGADAGAAPQPGYGPLVADPAKRLALPQGFSYKVISEAGVTTLESGEFTPATTTAPAPSGATAAAP